MSAAGNLEARLRAVEAELEQLRSEVRTRRVVVVDETGFERVVVSTLPESGAVEVFGRTREGYHKGDAHSATLIASEETVRPYAGLFLRAFDNNVGVLEVSVDDSEQAGDGVALTSLQLEDIVPDPAYPGRAHRAENQASLTPTEVRMGDILLGRHQDYDG